MKINRLIEITVILLNRKTVTASELAERFGVSVRTIYRDIDVLSSSGVPVFTMQGVHGGISIMENYTLDRTLFSEKENENILFAVQAMQAVKYPEVNMILDKLGSLFQKSVTDWISIDPSPWGRAPNEYIKFEQIKNAILQSKRLKMDYINSFNQMSHRSIAPLRMMFKGQGWYLWGFCYKCNDYRTFRISRIKYVEVTEKGFDRRELTALVAGEEEKSVDKRPMVHLMLEFSEEVLYRLYDDFDLEILKKSDNGTYTVEIDYPEDEWVYGYILSFGESVKVISPPHIQKIIKDKAKKIHEHYNKI